MYFMMTVQEFQVKMPMLEKQKRKVGKLKKILMDCLLQKNILESPDKRPIIKKPVTQFLRFGKSIHE